MTELLRLDYNGLRHILFLPLTAVSSNPVRDFGFFHVRTLSSYTCSLWNVGGSSQSESGMIRRQSNV